VTQTAHPSRPSTLAAFDLLVCAVAAALVIAGTVGAWASVGGKSVTGLHIDTGVIALMSVTFGAALTAWRAVVPNGFAGVKGVAFTVWSAVFAATGVGAAAYALSSPTSAVGSGRSADASWGLYLSLVAAIVLLLGVASVLARHGSHRAPDSARAGGFPLEALIAITALFVLALGPAAFSAYWVSFILTQMLWLGIAAASLIFLSAYGGMVSLGQVAIYGIAAIVLGNVVTVEAKGLHLGWTPWLGVVLGIVIATAVGLLLGALASRSVGIYFLMLTLAFGVLTYYFFTEETKFSGFSGISGVQTHTPGLVGNPTTQPNRLYYIALLVAVVVYAMIRYLVKTPFGIALQGIRDDAVRMSSLGYNVALHRTLAFGLAAFVASTAGILYVWWNDHVDPTSIGLDPIINLLVVAVIGGLFRVEGAWIGAFAFVVINNEINTYNVTVPVVGGSFYTVIGLIFLGIVLISPGGIVGMWEWLVKQVGAAVAARPAPTGADADVGSAGTR
jgi:branched-chain amino acid transport system permease protein